MTYDTVVIGAGLAGLTAALRLTEQGQRVLIVARGVGAGANVLLGGFQKSIALQPVSVEGQNDLNVAAGIAELPLNYEGLRRPNS